MATRRTKATRKGAAKAGLRKRRSNRPSSHPALSGRRAHRRRGRAAGKRAPLSKTRGIVPGRGKRRGYSLLMAPGLDMFVGASERLSKACRNLGDHVTFTVAPKTVSNEAIQAQRGQLNNRDINQFRPRPDAEEAAIERLLQLGVEIVHRGRFGTTVMGSAELVSDVLKVELAVHAKRSRPSMRATQSFAACYEAPAPTDLFVAPVDSLTIKSTISDDIDDFVFIPPPVFFAPTSATEPGHGYYGIGKEKIRQLLNVPAGATGAGVTVGMVDTGFFNHPYYTANSLDYRPVQTASAPDPTSDPEGHGTAMAYNTFAVASGVTVKGFKRTGPPQIALEEAVDDGVDIVSCAWGWPSEARFPIVEATIKSIVDEGKIVLFAAGDGMQCWPASMPGVLAVGGVYADQANVLEASNYASGFLSNHSDYNRRRVPDICGLCGQSPKGIYIMLPCPSRSVLDRQYAGQSFPNRDETPANDGWFSASGTSSATAQVAGVVALMVERARSLGRNLTTDLARTVLEQTATSVQKGKNAEGVAADDHPNTAVGFGLVNAAAAIARV